MTTTTDAPRAAQSHAGGPRVYRWQTPAVILVCGCLIAMLNFGPRSALGQFLNPDVGRAATGAATCSRLRSPSRTCSGARRSRSPGRSPTSTAPSGCSRVGAILYALGLTLMAYSTSPGMLDLSGRRAGRVGARRLLVQPRHRRVRQADAGAVAHAFLRRRNRGRIVRPVPVLAAGRRHYRGARLADRADRVRRPCAHGPAVVVRARHPRQRRASSAACNSNPPSRR